MELCETIVPKFIRLQEFPKTVAIPPLVRFNAPEEVTVIVPEVKLSELTFNPLHIMSVPPFTVIVFKVARLVTINV